MADNLRKKDPSLKSNVIVRAVLSVCLHKFVLNYVSAKTTAITCGLRFLCSVNLNLSFEFW